MTNNVRGIVSQDIDGERFELCLSANEWCELEDEFGKTTDALLKEFGAMAEKEQLDMRMLRSFFRAALSYSRPTTLHDAGVVMRTIGLVESAALIGKVIIASMPEVKQPAGKPKKAAAQR